MKKILKIIVPSILILILIYLMRDGKDILDGLYFIFPILYIVMGLIYSSFKGELLISMLLTSLAFIIPINLCFKMGTCIEFVLIYNILSCASFGIKKRIRKNFLIKDNKID